MLRFTCTWLPGQIPRRSRSCLWSLSFPGLERYGEGTGWASTAWVGMLRNPRPPRTRQTVSRRPLRDARTVVRMSTGQGTLSLGAEAVAKWIR